MFSRRSEVPDSESETPAQGTFLLRENQEDPDYRLAKCCAPIPGDDVIGYTNPEISDDIVIHKSNCPIALKLISSQAENILEANWTSHKVIAHLARIRANGIDKIGIINEITNVISKQLNVNIRSMHIESRDGIFESELDLYVHNTEDLNNLLLSLSKIKGMDNVKRIEKS